jgi:4,5-DOPA dioxygenase extradiol
MPAVFAGHGSPMNTLENNRYTDAWRAIGASLPRPRAILAVSAHWFVRGTKLTAMPLPRTIHDFGGFPEALFAFEYPAPGDPALAERVRELCAPLGATLDASWGLDHGTWSVLAHMFPEADVPVVQLSLDRQQPASFHYDLGARLAPLRDENVLVLGSGNVVHNLDSLYWERDAAPFDWAVRFNDAVRAAIAKRDHAMLVDYDRLGLDANLAVPTPDHFLPLLYVLALQDETEPTEVLIDGIELGSVGMLSVVVGGQ